jgi:cysteine synthase B
MFAHQHAARNCRERFDCKTMSAEEFQRLIKIRIAGFSSHVRVPVCEDVEIEVGGKSVEQQRRILNLAYLERRLQFPMKTGNALPASGGSLGASLGSALPERIGSTPLIRLDGVVRPFSGITLLAKAEWANPGGSVKDRAAASMVADARARGLLPAGKTLLDASSGNTGIAFAMLGAALGFPVHLAMPTNVSPERKRILRAYGAQMDWTDPDQGSDGAIRRARELAGNEPDRFFYADQYSNDANWLAHYRTTGLEIWEQTAGLVTHFVAGLGTSGTFMGTTRRLKEFNSTVQAISFQPDSPFHGLEGLKYMGSSIVPAIYNPHLADRELEVDTEAAYDMAKRLARNEGLLVGISAAAAVVACLKIAEEESAAGREAVIVTVLPDSADKYLSERFWEEDGWAYSI